MTRIYVAAQSRTISFEVCSLCHTPLVEDDVTCPGCLAEVVWLVPRDFIRLARGGGANAQADRDRASEER